MTQPIIAGYVITDGQCIWESGATASDAWHNFLVSHGNAIKGFPCGTELICRPCTKERMNSLFFNDEIDGIVC